MADLQAEMEGSSTIDLRSPNVETEVKPEKMDDGKDRGPLIQCHLYDKEIIHKMAQVFLPGLATACVDNTSGDIFRTPASVAVDIRKEMVDYLTQRGESFITESIVLENGPDSEISDHPYDIISDMVEDFASLKRNLFSRVSGWLLSEKREDKIDDFVQEMDINRFWLIDRREALALTVLKNIDLKNEFHCNMKIYTSEDLAEHIYKCGFRSMSCMNEGCSTTFCARLMEKHDSVCPFKIISCEQNCSDMVMRREMDRHCITACSMKLVNCPFYSVGCQSGVPYRMMEKHFSDDLHSHLIYILRSIHDKEEVSEVDLKRRVEQLEKVSSGDDLFVRAQDARSLTFAVKDLEAKIGSMELKRKEEEKKEGNEGGKEGSEEKKETSNVKNVSVRIEDVASSNTVNVNEK